MKPPVIRARVFTRGRHMFHVDIWGRVGDRPGHVCTRRCKPYWLWVYEITVNGEVLDADNTGAWAPMYETALRKVTQARIFAGQVYAPPSHPIRTI